MKKETHEMMRVLGDGIRQMATNRAIVASRYSLKEFMERVTLTNGSYICADWGKVWDMLSKQRSIR